MKTSHTFLTREDAKRVTLGHAATMCIEKERSSDTPADDLIAYLSYRELTGHDTCDGYYNGYPAVNEYATPGGTAHSEHPSVLDKGRTISTAVFMPSNRGTVSSTTTYTQSRYSRTSDRWAPLRVIQKTLEVTTQLAKMAIRYPLRRHIRSRLSHMRAPSA